MSGWIGVDLDATLAEYYGWDGSGNIGKPMKPMVERVRKWLMAGHEVKIFTARACVQFMPSLKDEWPAVQKLIHDWLEKAGLPKLEITCVKDYGAICIYDDRSIQVKPNTR